LCHLPPSPEVSGAGRTGPDAATAVPGCSPCRVSRSRSVTWSPVPAEGLERRSPWPAAHIPSTPTGGGGARRAPAGARGASRISGRPGRRPAACSTRASACRNRAARASSGTGTPPRTSRRRRSSGRSATPPPTGPANRPGPGSSASPTACAWTTPVAPDARSPACSPPPPNRRRRIRTGPPWRTCRRRWTRR